MGQQANTQALQEIQQECYFPSIASYVGNCVREHYICMKDEHIHNTSSTPGKATYQNGIMDLKRSCKTIFYQNCHQVEVFRMMMCQKTYLQDTLCLSSFQPNGNQQINTANVSSNVMTRHAYLPTLKITHKGSIFVSRVKHEVAEKN